MDKGLSFCLQTLVEIENPTVVFRYVDPNDNPDLKENVAESNNKGVMSDAQAETVSLKLQLVCMSHWSFEVSSNRWQKHSWGDIIIQLYLLIFHIDKF